MASTQTATFLFCDLVESTALFELLGHDRADAVRRDVYAGLRRAVAANDGREIKGTGDGLFVVFSSGSHALDGAVAMQQTVARLDRRETAAPLALRVGVAVGDAVEEDDDWHGVPVVEAARLCAAASAGEILVSEPVHTLFGSRRAHEFSSPRELNLKGLGDRTVLSLRWRADVRREPLPRPLQRPTGSFFVGRDRELEHIGRVYEQATTSGRRLVLLGGEPGVGKTRLAAEAAARAHHDGATVMFGRSDEGVGMPYQPFVEALGPYLDTMQEAHLTPSLLQAISEVSRVVPSLATQFEGLAPPTHSDPNTERYLFFDAVVSLMTAAAADAPLVVVLDDLQWATQPTLLLLRHLMQAPITAALLIVGTYRDTDLDRTHPLSELLADLHRVEGIVRMTLAGLTNDGTAAFVVAMAGHTLDEEASELARILGEATLGNPLFLREVLLHLVDTGAVVQDDDGMWHTARGLSPASIGLPRGVREIIARRVGRLTDAANQVLPVAAVVGTTFDLDLLEAIPDAGEPARLIDALDEATRAGILVETATGYGFAHALIHHALYTEITAPRRIRLHRNVGGALEARDDSERHLEALAHHFGKCASDADLAKAIDYTLLAAERALDQVAGETALDLAERAIALVDRRGVRDDLRRAHAHVVLAEAYGTGRHVEAKEAALRGFEHARHAGSSEFIARCTAVFAAMSPTGQPDPVVEQLIDATLADLDVNDDDNRALVLAHAAEYRAIALGDNAGALPLAEEALRLARRGQSVDVLRWSLLAKLQALCGTPDVTGQLAVITELEELRGGPIPTRGFFGFEMPAFRARAHLELGDLAAFDRAAAQAALLPSTVGRSNAANLRAIRALVDGRFDDAQREADAMIGHKSDVDALNVYAGLVFFLQRESGHSDELVPMLEDVIAGNPGIPAFRCALAAVLCDTGRIDDARREFDDLMSDLAGIPRDYTWMGSLPLLAEVCAHLDDADAARVLYDELVPHSGHIVVAANIVSVGAAVDRYLGMLAAVLGEWDTAVSHYRAALELETRLPAPNAARHTQGWLDRLTHGRSKSTSSAS